MDILSKKSIYKDSLLNIISSLILTIAVQLLAYPFLGQKFSITEYGLILTTMGIINALGASLGTSLNNTRILLQSEYDDKELSGDYNIIFTIVLFLGSLLAGVVTLIIFKEFNQTAIGCIIITALILFRAYFSVSYRLVISYKKLLYSNVFGFLGYLIGITITKFTNEWIYIFILGELSACIYIFFTSGILREKFQTTPLFKKSLNKFIFIMSASVLSSIMMYMDRFYIYPFLGAEKVSVYTVASFLGKTAGLVMNPISGVLLTYYAKSKKITINQFIKQTCIFIIFSLLIYIIIILVGIPITRLLYPTIINDSIPYFYIANLAAITYIIGNTIQPTLLRYCNVKWQPIIQVIYFVLYLIIGYFGMIYYGLLGFCYSLLIVNVLRIILMVGVVIKSLYINKEKNLHL